MKPGRPALFVAVGCAVAWLVGPQAVRAQEPSPRAPNDVPGLVAWYHLDPVHRRSREGEPVHVWPDSSGHERQIQATWDQQAPQFHPNRLNGKPEVMLRRANRFDVFKPFDLGDHTIFLVYDSALTKRAFLSSDADPQLGIVLREEGTFHYFQDGKRGDIRYNRVDGPNKGFTVTVLARSRGTLRSFIDGADVSSGLRVDTTLRVARLFTIEHTVRVGSDGEGMRIAEMAFYDRYLTDDERNGVTAHLAEKFGLKTHFAVPVSKHAASRLAPVDDKAVRLRASTRSGQDLNQPTVALAWDLPGRIDPPFHFDAESGGTRIVCAADGTRARVSVKIPLLSSAPGARIRLLILVDGREYLPTEALSEPFDGSAEQKVAKVELQVELTLNAGQYFQVVTSTGAEPGAVRLSPSEALLLVEQL